MSVTRLDGNDFASTAIYQWTSNLKADDDSLFIFQSVTTMHLKRASIKKHTMAWQQSHFCKFPELSINEPVYDELTQLRQCNCTRGQEECNDTNMETTIRCKRKTTQTSVGKVANSQLFQIAKSGTSWFACHNCNHVLHIHQDFLIKLQTYMCIINVCTAWHLLFRACSCHILLVQRARI